MRRHSAVTQNFCYTSSGNQSKSPTYLSVDTFQRQENKFYLGNGGRSHFFGKDTIPIKLGAELALFFFIGHKSGLGITIDIVNRDIYSGLYAFTTHGMCESMCF
jgi:hypothetical protein